MDQNGYGVDYGDAYMEQEEEWEREGLLDPAWEKQQKKVNSINIPNKTNAFFPVNFLSCAFIVNDKLKWIDEQWRQICFSFWLQSKLCALSGFPIKPPIHINPFPWELILWK